MQTLFLTGSNHTSLQGSLRQLDLANVTVLGAAHNLRPTRNVACLMQINAGPSYSR